MSTGAGPSSSTSNSNFSAIFNAALGSYKKSTKKDLTSHPLLASLESCDSPEAILAVLQHHIPGFNQSQNGDNRMTKWVTPTVNVLYTFSVALGQAGQSFLPINVVCAGISVLLLAAKDTSATKEKLIHIFNRIENFFRRLETYTSLTPTAPMLDMIVKIMVEVLAILATATREVKSGYFKKFFKKLLGNTDIEDSLERLDRLTQEEARMAAAEQLKMTQTVDNKVVGVDDRVKGVANKVQGVSNEVQGVGNQVQDVRGDVQDIQDKVQNVDARVQGVDDKLAQANRNQLKDSLLRWLAPPDPSTNHNIATKAHHDGTAEWFFRGSIFKKWKSTGSSLLWIHGKPGSGKSVLCSSIIKDVTILRDGGKALMAYFYFDFRDVNKQRLQSLLPALLTQLGARSDACCDLLSRLHSAHDRGLQRPCDREMIDCLKEMLTLKSLPPIYIILDALDECSVTSTIPPSPREEVLEFVEDLVGFISNLPNVHLCVTSRPEHDIRVVLEPRTEHPVSLHDESGQQEDISEYVSSFVRSNHRMQKWRREDRDVVVKAITENADGMFRWVYCQLEILRHSFPSSVRRILEELPESLDETYERILKDIRKPNQALAHRLLQCLVAAIRPLEVKELAEVLAFDFNTEGIPTLNEGWRWEDQEEAVMSACSSLVTIVNTGETQVVQFSHFSVKEFLTAERLAEPIRDVSRYHIQTEAAHTIIARACLGILLRLDSIDTDSMTNYPLAPYAAQHWPSHARTENVASHIKDGLIRLFDAERPYYAAWIWLYDEDKWGRSMETPRPEKPDIVPLYYASKLGFRELAEHLIAKNPEHVFKKGGEEITPLHAAASAGHRDILQLLLENGADVNGKGLVGNSPLHRASRMCRVEAGEFLIDQGADVDARNSYKSTPLIYSTDWNHAPFIRLLLDRGASIDSRGIYGRTAMHWAAVDGQTEVVQLLLERGADALIPDEDGNTACKLGYRKGFIETVRQLPDFEATAEKS